ncbi:MAG: hypothetical protein ACYTKD_31120, partial [Planctomycetota bacterium]
MPNFCNCGGSKNTGVKGTAFKKPFKKIFVPIFAADGTRNKILASDTLDQAYIDARINDPDPTKRWYPVGEFVTYTSERAAPTLETFANNQSNVTEEGARVITLQLNDYPAKDKRKLDALACGRFGEFQIDKCGNLRGIENADQSELYPIEVNKNYFHSILVDSQDGQGQKIQLTYEISQSVYDGDLSY